MAVRTDPPLAVSNAVNATARFLLALAIGATGGYVFYRLHAPLAWMLGPMFACAAASLLRAPISTPSIVRPPVTALIGTMLGTSFTANTFAGAGEWIVPILGLLLFIAAAAGSSYIYFRRIGGFDQATAFFAGMPGGLVEMVSLGGERGGDERMIALVHSARIFLVVMALPFLIQLALGVAIPRSGGVHVPFEVVTAQGLMWFLGTYVLGIILGQVLRLPARFMFGPLIVSALVHFFALSDFKLPTDVIIAAQIVIGCVIGCRFVGTAPRLILRMLFLSLGSTVVLLGITFAFALAVAKLSGEDFASIVLAYSPGGLAEMSLVALALNGEVAFVVLHHIIRVALVVVSSTIAFRLIAGSGADAVTRPPAPKKKEDKT